MRDKVKQTIIGLMEANGGRITPDDVIAEAKKRDSPLHDCFEWDKGKAAMEHWRQTARELIRSVRVVITNQTVTIRAPYFVRDPSANHKQQGYVAISSVRSETDEAREVLVEEFTRASAVLRRAKEVARALNMDHEVEGLINGVLDLRSRVTA